MSIHSRACIFACLLWTQLEIMTDNEAMAQNMFQKCVYGFSRTYHKVEQIHADSVLHLKWFIQFKILYIYMLKGNWLESLITPLANTLVESYITWTILLLLIIIIICRKDLKGLGYHIPSLCIYDFFYFWKFWSHLLICKFSLSLTHTLNIHKHIISHESSLYIDISFNYFCIP